MAKKYEKNCEHCKRPYQGVGRLYCSHMCSRLGLRGEFRMRYWLNKNRSLITREKIKKNNAKYWFNKEAVYKGKKHWNWKGGITPENLRLRQSIQYRRWREAIFKRDNFTCQLCFRKKEVSGRLHADHIKQFAYFPELRFSIENGRTLCIECHRTTPSFRNRWYNPFNSKLSEFVYLRK